MERLPAPPPSCTPPARHRQGAPDADAASGCRADATAGTSAAATEVAADTADAADAATAAAADAVSSYVPPPNAQLSPPTACLGPGCRRMFFPRADRWRTAAVSHCHAGHERPCLVEGLSKRMVSYDAPSSALGGSSGAQRGTRRLLAARLLCLRSAFASNCRS